MVFETRQVWTSSQLPRLSVIGMKVLELSRRAETPSRELLDQLHTNPELCQRIVFAANSPWFNCAPQVATIEQAWQTLGTSDTTSLALALIVEDACLKSEPSTPLNTQFWRQAVVKAAAMETLCRQVREGLESEYFLAGLLADVGRFVLLRTAAESYLKVLEKARQELLPLWRVEQLEIDITAAQIGAQLLEQWGLPVRLVQGIQIQHAPLTTFKQIATTTDYPLWGTLALASAIGDYFCSEQQALAWFRIRELTSEILPMSESELNDLLQRIARRFTAVAPALSVSDVTLPDLKSLKARAIAQLQATQQSGSGNKTVKVAPGDGTTRRAFSADIPVGTPSAALDPLTQVYTPESFNEVLEQEVHRCRQLALPLGIAFVQVDRFDDLLRQHSDRFGNLALQRVAEMLKGLLRRSDAVARFDQRFGILASEPTAKGMQRLADRIRGRVASEPLVCGETEVPLTVSVGATLALPGRSDNTLASRILAAAQRAVHEAAIGEGNNVYFDSLVAETELKRLFMSNQFRFSRWLISKGVLDIPRVGKALLEFKQNPVRLGELAQHQKLLNQRDVDEILEDQEETQARFGDVAVRRELLSEEQLVGLLILQQEDPVRVAEVFLQKSILEEPHLRSLLKEYFSIVPWAAPLYPSAAPGNA